MRQFINKTKGFTVTELLIVIVIVGIMVGIGTPYYQQARSRFIYTNHLTQTIELMKTARNYAVTSRAYFDGSDQIVPENGYGVYIDQSPADGDPHIILFANVGNDPERYDLDDGVITQDDAVQETLSYPNQVVFEEIEVIDENGFSADPDNAVIIFTPPVADAFVGINFEPTDPGASVDPQETLRLKFRRPESSPGTISDTIRFNKNAGFPELEL